MKNKREAFTIIELVFVILIMGILLTVMIPRLMASSDDSRIAVSLSEVGILVSELTTFYTYRAYFSSDLSEMTSVRDANYTTAWNTLSESATLTYFTPKNASGLEPCMQIFIKNQDGNMTISSVIGVHDNVCRGLQKVNFYKKILGTKSLEGNKIF